MKIFKHIAAVGLALLLGILGGQHLANLGATDYPGGGGAADGFTDPTAANTWTAAQTYNDSVNILLGTGGDSSISFVDPNLQIDGSVVGSGRVVFLTDNAAGGQTSPRIEFQQEFDDNNSFVFGVYYNDSSPTDLATPFFVFNANDSGSTRRGIGYIAQELTDVTSTTMDSRMLFATMDNVNSDNASTVAQLTANGTFTDASGRANKRFEGSAQSVWGARVIDKLPALQIERYHSGKLAPGVPPEDIQERHVSPTAEDLWDMFQVGRDPRKLDRDLDNDGVPETATPGIAAKDLGGLALMAIQELIQENKKLKERLDVLELP